MNANWAHEFMRWSCSFTAQHGLSLPRSLSINPVLFFALVKIMAFLVKKLKSEGWGGKVSSICWWCVTMATALSATKVSAAGSVRAGERERTNNVLDGNPRGEEVHRESGVASKGGIRNEAARPLWTYQAETSESEHTTSRSHLPPQYADQPEAFHNSQRQTYCLKLPFMMWT